MASFDIAWIDIDVAIMQCVASLHMMQSDEEAAAEDAAAEALLHGQTLARAVSREDMYRHMVWRQAWRQIVWPHDDDDDYDDSEPEYTFSDEPEYTFSDSD